MEGTDVATGNVDNSMTHDHTYFGNGCPGVWENVPPYYGGSPTACSTRIVKTYDNEYLSIGTYYHFQAATAGTGGSMTTANTNSPDTFCPLGWQLPYGGEGGDYYNKSKSWSYLLGAYSITTSQQDIYRVRSYPLSLILSGNYYWGSGALGQLNTVSHYWSLTVTSDIRAYRFHLGADYIKLVSQAIEKNGGEISRCVLKLASNCNYLVYDL